MMEAALAVFLLSVVGLFVGWRAWGRKRQDDPSEDSPRRWRLRPPYSLSGRLVLTVEHRLKLDIDSVAIVEEAVVSAIRTLRDDLPDRSPNAGRAVAPPDEEVEARKRALRSVAIANGAAALMAAAKEQGKFLSPDEAAKQAAAMLARTDEAQAATQHHHLF